MAVTKPYEFIRFGAMAVTKPYEFIGFGAMAVTKPYEFIPEGSLAGILLGRFLGPGRPLGASKPSKNVGGEAPHIFGWF